MPGEICHKCHTYLSSQIQNIWKLGGRTQKSSITHSYYCCYNAVKKTGKCIRFLSSSFLFLSPRYVTTVWSNKRGTLDASFLNGNFWILLQYYRNDSSQLVIHTSRAQRAISGIQITSSNDLVNFGNKDQSMNQRKLGIFLLASFLCILCTVGGVRVSNFRVSGRAEYQHFEHRVEPSIATDFRSSIG